MSDDMTGFQRDLLTVIAGQGPIIGLDLMDELERYYGQEMNHGRLYPNLDTLAERGLIRKTAKNKRANNYAITARGVRELEAQYQFIHDNITKSWEIDRQSSGEITFRER